MASEKEDVPHPRGAALHRFDQLHVDDEDDGITSDEEAGETLKSVPPPALSLMRNVSGYDVRGERLRTKCDALSRGSEAKYFRLMSASINGDDETVKRVLETMTKAEVAQLNPVKEAASFGLNPLHVANSIGVVKLILEKGVHINIKGLNGQTALHCHTQNKNSGILRYLIEQADIVIDAMDDNGSTPLQWAVCSDDLKYVKLLVDAGANVRHANYSGNTALHMASSVECCQLLIHNGARTDVTNGEGRLPLEEAANRAVGKEKHLNAALYLLDVSRKAFFSRGHSFESSGSGGDDEQGSADLLDAENEFQSYQSMHAEEKTPTSPIGDGKNDDGDDRIALYGLHAQAKRRWNIVKRAFITGRSTGPTTATGTPGTGDGITMDQRSASFSMLPGLSASPRTSLRGGNKRGRRASFGSIKSEFTTEYSSISKPDYSSEDFYSTFFEVMVKERPALALKVLDKQRTFLYWDSSTKVYSYNMSLLGTIPRSSFALKQMVYYDHADLISHRVVQYMLNLRWILFTREILFFEFLIHLLFLALILITSLAEDRQIVFSVLDPAAGIFVDPSFDNYARLFILVCHVVLMFVNLRYVKIQVAQAKIARILGQTQSTFSRILHCRLRNEPYYLVPHILILVSQILRCFSNQPSFYVMADIINAIVSPRLFYRALSFGEGFEQIGVPLCTIRSMIAENSVYYLVVFVLVSGFSHSMYLIFRDETGSLEFGSLPMAWTTMFFFAFNLDVTSLNSEEVSYRKVFGFLTVGMYMFIVSLVTFNLVVAVMTNTYEKIYRDSKAQYLLQKARLILFYEQYEEALNTIMFSRPAQILQRVVDGIPPGDPRHYVKENANGKINIEVPKTYIEELMEHRRRSGGLFHRIRYFAFKRWKTLRRSSSFLWPDHIDYMKPLQKNENTPLISPAIDNLNEKSDLFFLGAFQVGNSEEEDNQHAYHVHHKEEGYFHPQYHGDSNQSSSECTNCKQVLKALRIIARTQKEMSLELIQLRGMLSKENGGTNHQNVNNNTPMSTPTLPLAPELSTRPPYLRATRRTSSSLSSMSYSHSGSGLGSNDRQSPPPKM